MKLTPSTGPTPLKLTAIAKPKWGSPQEIYTRHCMCVEVHRHLYYEMSRPVLQDHEYDLYERFLKHLENTTGVYHEKSPLRTVGGTYTISLGLHNWALDIDRGVIKRENYFPDYIKNPDWAAYLNSISMGD
jgi:hypothetical protein